MKFLFLVCGNNRSSPKAICQRNIELLPLAIRLFWSLLAIKDRRSSFYKGKMQGRKPFFFIQVKKYKLQTVFSKNLYVGPFQSNISSFFETYSSFRIWHKPFFLNININLKNTHVEHENPNGSRGWIVSRLLQINENKFFVNIWIFDNN